jgi:hypothetical protein
LLGIESAVSGEDGVEAGSDGVGAGVEDAAALGSEDGASGSAKILQPASTTAAVVAAILHVTALKFMVVPFVMHDGMFHGRLLQELFTHFLRAI